MSTDEKNNNPIEPLKSIGVFFGAATPISIVLGSLLMYIYLSKNNVNTYFIEVISTPSMLIASSIYIGILMLLSGVIFSCNFIFKQEFKIGKKSLYEHLKHHHEKGNKLEVKILNFFYSSLLVVAIAMTPLFRVEYGKAIITVALITISIASSIISLWVFEKNKRIPFSKYLNSYFSFSGPLIKNWWTHALFFFLISVNVFSIFLLIAYVPKSEKVESVLGGYYFILAILVITIIIYAVNYIYIISNKKVTAYVTVSLLISMMVGKIHFDDNDKVFRDALMINENKKIIISKKIRDELSLSSVSEEYKPSSLFTISYKSVIVPTNENFIIKTNDNSIVSLPKSQVIGEITYSTKN